MNEHDERPDDGRRLPCTLCGKSTPVRVLNHLGARCSACFDAYCRAPQPPGKPAVRRPQAPVPADPEGEVAL